VDRRSRLGAAAACGAAASGTAAQVSDEGARARRGDGARGHGEATRGHGETTRSAAARDVGSASVACVASGKQQTEASG